MGLLTKTVTMRWIKQNKEHYISKGYEFTKYRDEFIVNVEDLTSRSHRKVDVKCDGICDKEIKISWETYVKYVKEDGLYYCNKCSKGLRDNSKRPISFAEWCVKNNFNKELSRFNKELNNCKPENIGYSTNKLYWFNCPRDIHEPEKQNINKLTSGQGTVKCKKCNSFAQWGIDNIGENFLELYWDNEKNSVLGLNPWEISYGSLKEVWLKCQSTSYHGSYAISCNSFTNKTVGCPYCDMKKIHKKDSLGQFIIDKYGYYFIDKIWSKRNKNSPFKYAPKSHTKVYWKCENAIHGDYNRKISNSNIMEFNCPKCASSKGERRIEEYLKCHNLSFICQKEFDNLVGLKNGKLSYDFYLQDFNLLIEYQGEYHDGTARNQTEQQFEVQQEHDRRKREYAKLYDIELLEIWYWDFDNINKILENKLNQIILKGGET